MHRQQSSRAMPEVTLLVSPAVTAASQAHENLNSLLSCWVHHVHNISHPAGGRAQGGVPMPMCFQDEFFAQQNHPGSLWVLLHSSCSSPICQGHFKP